MRSLRLCVETNPPPLRLRYSAFSALRKNPPGGDFNAEARRGRDPSGGAGRKHLAKFTATGEFAMNTYLARSEVARNPAKNNLQNSSKLRCNIQSTFLIVNKSRSREKVAEI